VAVAERYADGQASHEERQAAGHEANQALGQVGMVGAADRLAAAAAYQVVFCDGWSKANRTAELATRAACGAARPTAGEAEMAAQAALLRDLFGPLPFRPVTIPAAVLTWNSGSVVQLATSIYENSELPSGVLAAGRLAVLADALEEAGLGDQEVLGHLRQQGSVHCRGCWPIDSCSTRSDRGRGRRPSSRITLAGTDQKQDAASWFPHRFQRFEDVPILAA
jgi:hypothetical protein